MAKMLRRFFVWMNTQFGEYAFSGAYIVILFAGTHTKSLEVLRGTFLLVALIAFFAWFYTLRSLREIINAPTSTVISAHQGYVELKGVVRPLAECSPLFSPRDGSPCVWYRHRCRWVEGKRVCISLDVTEIPFLLNDGTADCIVNPTGVSALVREAHTWAEGSYQHTEWLVRAGETLYCLGEFKTYSNVGKSNDIEVGMKALLEEWKRDQKQLLERFDLDKNGVIDQNEWMLARQAARREIRRRINDAENVHSGQTHTLSCPDDGRVFLMSNIDPENMTKRLRIWSFVHLAIFFIGLLGAVALIT